MAKDKKFEEALKEARSLAEEIRNVAESLAKGDASSASDVADHIDNIEAAVPQVAEKVDAQIESRRQKIAELESQIAELEDAMSLPNDFIDNGSDLLRQHVADQAESGNTTQTIREILGVAPAEPDESPKASLGTRLGRSLKSTGSKTAGFFTDLRNEFKRVEEPYDREDEGGGDDEH